MSITRGQLDNDLSSAKSSQASSSSKYATLSGSIQKAISEINLLIRNPTIMAGSIAGKAGTTVQVPFTFSGGPFSIAAIQFDLILPASLTVGTPVAGPIVSTASKSISTNQISTSDFRVIVSGLNQNVFSAGLLMTLPVTIVSGTPSGITGFSIQGLVYSDPNGIVVQPGSVFYPKITIN